MKERTLIFEKSRPGRKAYSLPECDVPAQNLEDMVPEEYLRDKDALLPEVSEVDVVRHYTCLSRLNHGVDSGFYPLGSCTMKYNPKVNEDIAKYEGFVKVHPLQPANMVQGCLELMFKTDSFCRRSRVWTGFPFSRLPVLTVR